MSLAELVVAFVQIWAAIGGLVCVAFLFFGLDRIDPAAHDSYAFRPLLIPGIVVIWPLVLWRWWSLEQLNKHGCPAVKDGDVTAGVGDGQ